MPSLLHSEVVFSPLPNPFGFCEPDVSSLGLRINCLKSPREFGLALRNRKGAGGFVIIIIIIIYEHSVSFLVHISVVCKELYL